MFSLLHQYLINHSSLALPGIGTLQFVDTSAQPLDDGQMMPPRREIKLLGNEANKTSPQLTVFLARQLDMEEQQANGLFNYFLEGIQSVLQNGKAVEWKNIGELTKNSDGEISFSETIDLSVYYQPIKVDRIHFNNIDSNYRLTNGNETNSVLPMASETYSHEKSHWWIWAIIIGVLAATIIAIKFSG